MVQFVVSSNTNTNTNKTKRLTHPKQKTRKPPPNTHSPAVVISMFVAGVSAILSALCYSEFAVQFPYAGGAFNYCAVTLGELPAWLVVCMLVLSYILANAAIARSFSAYFAQLVGQEPGFFTFPYKGRRN